MAAIKLARENMIEALRKATFETAAFDPFGNGEVDRLCKEKTALYRESWLIPPIMDALRAIDPCKECKALGVDYILEPAFKAVPCKSCKGYGIAKGLPFDPYELSRQAVEKAATCYNNHTGRQHPGT